MHTDKASFKPHWLVRYVAAVAAVGAGFLVRAMLTALVGEGLPTYITFYPVIMAVALLGGAGPGLVATFASALAVDYWLLAPVHELGVARLVDAVGLAFFSGVGVFMSVVAELYQRARQRAAGHDTDFLRRKDQELPWQPLGETALLVGGVVLALAILGAVGSQCYRNVAATVQAERLVNHTHIVDEGLEHLFATLRDMEASERGYLIMGADDYLRTYNAASQSVAGQLALLKRLTGDNPAQVQRLKDIEALADAKLAELKEVIEVRRSQGLEAARNLMARNQGQTVTDELRKRLTEAEDEERRLLDLRTDARDADLRKTLLALLSGGVLSLLLLTTVFVFLAQENSRRRRAEAELRRHQADLQNTVAARTADLSLANESLRQSEQRLAFALETSHTAAWELDLVDHTAHRSLEHDRIFGYAQRLPQWTYEMFLEHVLPEDRPVVDGKFRHAVETGTDWSFECRIRRADQQVRWIWAAGRHRTDVAGVRRGLTGIVQDITERKLAENAVLQLNTELRQRLADLQGANEEVQASRRAALSLAEDAQEARQEAERVNANLQKANQSLDASRRSALNLMDDAIQSRHQAEQANAELQRLNRTLQAHSSSDQALAHAKSEAEFTATVCRIVVEDCGHAMVWMGFAEEDEARTVRPVAQAGFEEGYLETLHITWADTERGRGPTGTAIRTGRPSRCRNMQTDPAFAPWREEALKRGYASSLVLPLLADGKVFGAMTIYSRQSDGFSNDEESLLTKLAGDLAFGITEFRLRAAKERAEEALRQSEERYRGLVELSPEAVLVNQNDRIVLVNAASLRLFGASSAEQLLGKSLFELFHADYHALKRERIGKMLAGERTAVIEEKIVRLDGMPVDVEVAGSPVTDQGERAVLLLLRDITERKRSEAALRQTAADLERSNHDLEQFAYVASHDLQEPLRAVGGYVKLLQHRFPDKLDAKAQGYIAGAFEGATRMERLITDLLAFSRVGTRGGHFVPADLDAVLHQALDNLQAGIESARATITHDPLPTLSADATQMLQLFQNLIGNALKFHGESPPTIHIRAQKQDRRWLFSVRDNGIGIEPPYFEKIFKVFQRLHTRNDYPGTGIGLAICKKIVERHGGTIWVESQPGQGATFHFTIPEAKTR